MHLRMQYHPTGISAIIHTEMLSADTHNRRWVLRTPKVWNLRIPGGPETVHSHSGKCLLSSTPQWVGHIYCRVPLSTLFISSTSQ